MLRIRDDVHRGLGERAGRPGLSRVGQATTKALFRERSLHLSTPRIPSALGDQIGRYRLLLDTEPVPIMLTRRQCPGPICARHVEREAFDSVSSPPDARRELRKLHPTEAVRLGGPTDPQIAPDQGGALDGVDPRDGESLRHRKREDEPAVRLNRSGRHPRAAGVHHERPLAGSVQEETPGDGLQRHFAPAGRHPQCNDRSDHRPHAKAVKFTSPSTARASKTVLAVLLPGRGGRSARSRGRGSVPRAYRLERPDDGFT